MNYEEIKTNKLTNLAHTIVLLLAMVGVLGFLGWMIAGLSGIIFAILFSAISLLFTPKVPLDLIMKAYGAKRLNPSSIPRLHSITLALSKNADLKKIPAIYYSPSRILNAFAAGSKDNSAILVTDGLLNTLNATEMAGIIGHEITHIKNNDMQVMWIANLFNRLTGSISFVGQMLILMSLPFLLISDVNIPFLPLVLLIFSPTLSFLLNLALSRTREFEADLGSAVLTGNPNFLVSALNKLEHYKRKSWPDFFITRPMNPQIDFLSTHPATNERIKRLLILSPDYKDKLIRSNYTFRIPTVFSI
ncbi:zinc metalloprotease HtpX [Desulfobacula sp.]|uniref:zinc metalloprotease HtpX n=1 Tax=Desulfobacula sp. TaxID=2593537 RepID=UPI002605C524|nr:zinc metalloprotease HtpX [Desulfobacula sp.]